jgi:hypothetical protein
VERRKILCVGMQGFKCPIWDFFILNTPPHMWRDQPNTWIVILGDMEEITCFDIILKIEHPIQNQFALGGETQDLMCREARF